MQQMQERPPTSSPVPDPTTATQRVSGQLPLWQVNLLRVGYLVMGGGLAIKKWPLLFGHAPWELMEGTVQCLLIAMSVLALLGLRYPVRMLPILLFEVTWKLLWLGVVALPLWLNGELAGSTLEQTVTVLWVLIVIAVVPWRYVLAQYVTSRGHAWRRNRFELRP